MINMKVLLINEFNTMGGTEIQSKREINMMRKRGHDYYYLTFDPYVDPKTLEDKFYNIPIDFSNNQKIKHRMFTSHKYIEMISKIIDEIHPDVIHMNNVFNLPLDVYKCVAKYPTFQTIRDFAAVCPKSTCIFDDYSACLGYKHHSCKECTNDMALKFKLMALKKINKARLASVNQFICPSQALSDVCTNNGLPTKCVNNQFDFSIIKKEEITSNSKTFMYYGRISKDKGVNHLVDAFNKICEETKEYKLIFIGGVDKPYEEEFNSLIKVNPNISYLGKKSNSEIMEIYKDIYCVIVPSLWLENYPNTVLESIANKTLVIGSNRGGIPELIGNSDLLFDITKKDDLYHKIQYVISLDKDKYIEFVEDRYNFIKENNSSDTYCMRLENIMKDIINK